MNVFGKYADALRKRAHFEIDVKLAVFVYAQFDSTLLEQLESLGLGT